MEKNPNHPVTADMHDEWHKIVAALMMKFAPSQTVVITMDDIERIEGLNVACNVKNYTIELRIVTNEEAEKLLDEHGGRPT